MSIANLLDQVLQALEELSDPERVAYGQKYHPTEMHVLGIKNGDVRMVLKELKKQVGSVGVERQIELGHALVETGVFECRHLAYEWLGKSKHLREQLTILDLERLGKGLDNWVSVDTFGVLLVGKMWQTKQIAEEWIQHFLGSENVWYRRLAVVSTVPLNQKAHGGTGDAKLTLSICRKVVDDHEDMVVKALSWALRVLSVPCPQEVAAFMEAYTPKLHKRVVREVWRKLETGTKN